MAIKIKNSTIIDDSRNLVDVGISTITSLSIGSTEVISSSRQLKNINSLDETTTATIESAIANAPNTFTDLNVTGISTLNVVSANSLNVVGIVTAGGFDGGPLSGSSGSFTQIDVSGIGTIATLDTNNGTIDFLSGTNINASGIVTASSYTIGLDVGISTTRTTVATLSATTIDSFAVATYRSARVQVQITQGTDYQTSDVLIIHDGSTASVIEYASIATDDYLGTFTGLVSGGNCLLQINMSSASSATVKVLSQKITV